MEFNLDELKSNIQELGDQVYSAFFDVLLNEQHITVLNETPPYYVSGKTAPFTLLEKFLHKHICNNDNRYKFRVYYKYDGVVGHTISRITLKKDDVVIFTYYNGERDYKYNFNELAYENVMQMVILCRNLVAVLSKRHEIVVDYFYNSGYTGFIGDAVELILSGISLRNYFIEMLGRAENDYQAFEILENARELYEQHIADVSECLSIECASILDRYKLKNIFVDIQVEDMSFDFTTDYEDKDVPHIEYRPIRLTNNSGQEIVCSLQTQRMGGKINIHQADYAIPPKALVNIGEYLFNVSRYAKNIFVTKGAVNVNSQ